MSKNSNEQLREKSDDGDLHDGRLISVRIEHLVLADDARQHNPDAIGDMAVSLREVGMIAPIAVSMADKDDDGNVRHHVEDGGLRVAGAVNLGWTTVPAILLRGDTGHLRLCKIASNLFREDLTALERADLIAEWLFVVRRKGGRDAQPGGKQPRDKGVSQAAKSLKLSRRMVGRSEDIAAICADAREAIKKAGIDNNQKALLQIAKQKTPKDQARKAEEFVERANNANASAAGSPSITPDVPAGVEIAEADFDKLKLAWDGSPEFVAAWKAAVLPARERFIKNVLRPLAQSIADGLDEAANHE